MLCCTPTAEAFDAARVILEARSVIQDCVVLVVTDGSPVINKATDDGYDETGQQNYVRLTETCPGSYTDCKIMSNGEYKAKQVFESAKLLKDIGDAQGKSTEIFVVGVPNRFGESPAVAFFKGEESDGSYCRIGNDETVCTSCTRNACNNGNKNAETACFMIGSTTGSCEPNDLASDPNKAIVSEPVDKHTLVVTTGEFNDPGLLVKRIRDLICNENV